MKYRFMRVMVMFDLPTITIKDEQNYRRFHNFLIKNGFIMQQYSVYSKLVLNRTQADSIKRILRSKVPEKGLVQCFDLTEKQYANIEYMAGVGQSKILSNDKRWVEV